MVAGAALAPLPLWNGDVIAEDRGLLPSSRVELPNEWRQVATAVNMSTGTGKTLVLPQNTFYQVTTSWGYHGADTFIGQLVLDPVIQRFPGGYFEAPTGFEALVDEAQAALERGDTATADRALRALGVSHVIVRRDLVSDESLIPVDTVGLDSAVAALPTALPVHNSTIASVYEVDVGATIQVYGGLVAFASAEAHGAAIVRDLRHDTASSSSSEVPVDGVFWQVGNGVSAAEFDMARPGRYELVRLSDPSCVRTATVTAVGPSLVFTQDLTPAIRANGALLDGPSPTVMHVDPRSVWGLEDITGLHPFEDLGDIRTTSENPEVRAWTAEGPEHARRVLRG